MPHHYGEAAKDIKEKCAPAYGQNGSVRILAIEVDVWLGIWSLQAARIFHVVLIIAYFHPLVHFPHVAAVGVFGTVHHTHLVS